MELDLEEQRVTRQADTTGPFKVVFLGEFGFNFPPNRCGPLSSLRAKLGQLTSSPTRQCGQDVPLGACRPRSSARREWPGGQQHAFGRPCAKGGHLGRRREGVARSVGHWFALLGRPFIYIRVSLFSLSSCYLFFLLDVITTAGEEQFGINMTSIYLRNAHALILAFDVSSPNSLNQFCLPPLRSPFRPIPKYDRTEVDFFDSFFWGCRLPKWLAQWKRFAGVLQAPIIVVGTKHDLPQEKHLVTNPTPPPNQKSNR